MALNKLSEKLDQLSGQELGFEFDEVAVWSKLEQRMDNNKARPYWWVVAACLLAGFAFLPIEIFKNKTSQEQVISDNLEKVIEDTSSQDDAEAKKEVQVSKHAKVEFKILYKKEFVPIKTAEIPAMKLALEPITIPKKKENYRTAFAAEDISIIQASLGQPSIENGRTMTIRAQWQNSTEELNVNYQALKIKLYEKDE